MLNFAKYSSKRVMWKAVQTDILTLKTALCVVAEDVMLKTQRLFSTRNNLGFSHVLPAAHAV